MQPKRILHIIGKMDRAGAETMLMNLYRQIDRNSIQFDFVTFTYDKGDYDDEIISMGGKIIPIVAKDPICRMLKLTTVLKNNPEYQILHAHMLLSNALYLLAAKNAGVKYRISHSHNTSNGKFGIINKAYEKWALLLNRKLSTQKIACGELASQYLFGTKEDVLIFPNAVDVDEMINVADNSRDYIDNILFESSKDLGIKIIQVARLSKVKNHDFSLKIARQLKNRKVNFTLLIVGQGPLEDKLKSNVLKDNLQNNVHFLGVRSDITELMASADYMIMPSLHEGFPVVLVEAQTVSLRSLVSSNVSKEVDLGLNLVKFLDLNSPEPWVDYMLSEQISKPSHHIVKDKLGAQGFDVKENAVRLQQIYTSLK